MKKRKRNIRWIIKLPRLKQLLACLWILVFMPRITLNKCRIMHDSVFTWSIVPITSPIHFFFLFCQTFYSAKTSLITKSLRRPVRKLYKTEVAIIFFLLDLYFSNEDFYFCMNNWLHLSDDECRKFLMNVKILLQYLGWKSKFHNLSLNLPNIIILRKTCWVLWLPTPTIGWYCIPIMTFLSIGWSQQGIYHNWFFDL